MWKFKKKKINKKIKIKIIQNFKTMIKKKVL